MNFNRNEGSPKLVFFEPLPMRCSITPNIRHPCPHKPSGFLYFTCPVEGEDNIRAPRYFCSKHLECVVNCRFPGNTVEIIHMVHGERSVNKDQFLTVKGLQNWSK